MTTLPTGTVTFLFTDIEGSTQLWEKHPQGMQTALARHDSILREAVKSFQGAVVKTTGDGLHAVFSTAHQGVEAALAAQQALQAQAWEDIHPDRLRVRMGLHSGEAELRMSDYFGSAPNRAARVMEAGSGGQVLLSQAAAELARQGLPDGASLRSLGEHRLKDLARREALYQLVHPDLEADFPPVRSIEAIPNNLPHQLTSFVGRQAEISEVKALLRSAHLVTLAGPGGTGKTRLAQEASAEVMGEYPHGVWLVELAPLTDPAQIIPALAQVFNIQELGYVPLERLVVDYLREKKILLILDNCEHLVEACAHLAHDLLRQCPQLKLVASSREALGIPGEVLFRVPSLAPGEASRLFVERATSANPRFQLTGRGAQAVENICARLDGIPLAIELAAARTKLLTPEQIAARLDDRFRLLTGGSRTVTPRQQTLRAMIDWSYDLLSEDEQRLLRHTAVFVSGWNLEALEAVAGVAQTGAMSSLSLESLEQLVNKSLVMVEDVGGEMRFSLLETIRQYALEKLLAEGAPEVERIRRRHLDYFRKVLERAEPRLRGPEMVAAMDELEMEQDNLRAAIDWAMQVDPLAALRMVLVFVQMWYRRVSVSDSLAWVRQGLERAEQLVRDEGQSERAYRLLKANALWWMSNLYIQIGEIGPAREAILESIELARKLDHPQALASALGLGATVGWFMGELDTAQQWAEEALAASRAHGLVYEEALVAASGMFFAMYNTTIELEYAEVAVASAQRTGNPWLLGMAYSNAGRTAMAAGDLERARHNLARSAEIYQEMGDRSMYISVLSETGHTFRKQGRFAEAGRLYRQTLPVFRELGHMSAVAHELECLAFIAIETGDGWQRAAALLGKAEGLRDEHGSQMTVLEQEEYERMLARLREQAPPGELERAWAAGQALRLEAAVELGLDVMV